MTKFFLLVAAVVCLTACQTHMPPETSQVAFVKCPETRPEMCTMDYDPVCGHLSDGSMKTYPNGCNACSDSNVVSYTQGECN